MAFEDWVLVTREGGELVKYQVKRSKEQNLYVCRILGRFEMGSKKTQLSGLLPLKAESQQAIFDKVRGEVRRLESEEGYTEVAISFGTWTSAPWPEEG